MIRWVCCSISWDIYIAEFQFCQKQSQINMYWSFLILQDTLYIAPSACELGTLMTGLHYSKDPSDRIWIHQGGQSIDARMSQNKTRSLGITSWHELLTNMISQKHKMAKHLPRKTLHQPHKDWPFSTLRSTSSDTSCLCGSNNTEMMYYRKDQSSIFTWAQPNPENSFLV